MLQEQRQQLAAAGIDVVHLAEVQYCSFRFLLDKLIQRADERLVEHCRLFPGAGSLKYDTVVINKYYFIQFTRSPLDLRKVWFVLPVL